MRRGVRIALDWGNARIGVAASDPEGLLAFPLSTILAGPDELTAVRAVIEEAAAFEVYVGLPKTLRGTDGPAAQLARERAARLSDTVAVPVRLVDERLTTVSAARQLRAAGRRARDQRAAIDAAAAVAILEHALAAERSQGFPPGELLSHGPGETSRA